MAVDVDLIIPGLFDLPIDELDSSFLKVDLPAINQFLRFGRLYGNKAFDLESMLIEALGWSGVRTLPFAQAYAEPGTQDSNRNLLFKAIHLKADMYNAIVVPLEDNQVNNDDIKIIINDLYDLFKVDCDIREVQNGLWLMQLKQCVPALHYPHYLSVIGRKADPFIEQSRQVLPWYKLMNEMQMFMHQHEINRNRLESELLPINSLWFWGAGDLSKITKRNIDWYCDDELLKQFADVTGFVSAGLDKVKTHDFDNDSIIIDLALIEALKSPGEAGLQNLLSKLESRLFNPLLAMRFDLQITANSRYQWWKKSKSLLDFIEH
jgi:hypothetical protein